MKKLTVIPFLQRASRRLQTSRRRQTDSPSRVEAVEQRTLLAAAVFDAVSGAFRVSMDVSETTLVLGIDELGHLTLNGVGQNDMFGNPISTSAIRSIRVTGSSSNDHIDLSAVNASSFPQIVDRGVTISGGDGHDLIHGSDLRDAIFGGNGNDSVFGRDGSDLIRGGKGADTLNGDAGNDRLVGDQSFDVLYGGSGRDRIDGSGGTDSIFGNGGNDTLEGGTSADTIDGGDGQDVIVGEDGNDVLTGGGGHDTVSGGAGNDRISAGRGNDLIYGGTGNDSILGEQGADTVSGGEGDDFIRGQGGNDMLTGDAGADTLEGNTGSDILSGGSDDDLLIGSGDDDQVDVATRGESVLIDTRSIRVGAESDEIRSIGRVNLTVATTTELESISTLPASIDFRADVTDPIQGSRFVYERENSTTPVDGGLLLASAAGGRWKREIAAGEAVSVDWFGAMGDGVTDDSTAINRALQAAGEGAVIEFTPGKTYLINRMLSYEAGQTLSGYGATIKRGKQIKTTTSTAIEIGRGSRFLTVASTTGFEVGMTITVVDAAGPELGNHTILSIDGNVIELGGNWRKASTSGASVVTSFHMISRSYLPTEERVEGVVIEGLTLDGNGRNNTTANSWRLHDSIRFNSTNGIVREVTIVDSQSEGITANADNVLIENVVIDGAQGNGIHLSGGIGIRIRNNTIRNTNLGGPSVGHVGGAIAFSLNCPDAIITGNLLENALAGIGDFNSEGANGSLISGNTIRNTVYAFEAINVSASGKNADLTFRDNQIFDSGPVVFGDRSDVKFETGPENIRFLNNQFFNSSAIIEVAQNILFEGNTWTVDDPDAVVIWIKDSKGVSINDTILGGAAAIRVTGAETRDVTISGSLQNQRALGIVFEPSLADEFRAIIDHVAITGSSVARDDYVGIRMINGITVRDSEISVPRGQAGIDLFVNGSPNAAALVERNTVTTPSGVVSIRLQSRVSGQTIRNNFVQQPIDDLNGGNTVTGNSVIP
jgi:hypothetical protein